MRLRSGSRRGRVRSASVGSDANECPVQRGVHASSRRSNISHITNVGRTRQDGEAKKNDHSPRCRCESRPRRQSVSFGWPVPAWTSRTVLAASSMRHQSRPAPVTSYCHRSQATPFQTPCPSSPFSRCRLVGLALEQGSARSSSQARRRLALACRSRSDQPLTATASANRRSYSCSVGGGAIRSPSPFRAQAIASGGRTRPKSPPGSAVTCLYVSESA